jgi:hypothetical protein
VTRQRWFCRFCGAVTNRCEGVCAAHADLPSLVDAVPPDPLESLPVTAVEALAGEDMTPRKGTEA